MKRVTLLTALVLGLEMAGGMLGGRCAEGETNSAANLRIMVLDPPEDGFFSKRLDYEGIPIDFVKPGETNSEADHQLKGEKFEADEFNDRPYRLSRGGWFSYQLKVLSDRPTALVCTYWGGERPGTRVFDLLVDGEVVASQTLATNKPGRFFEESYPIPTKRTEGKNRVQVMLKAHPDKYAGAVFDLRTVRTLPSP